MLLSPVQRQSVVHVPSLQMQLVSLSIRAVCLAYPVGSLRQGGAIRPLHRRPWAPYLRHAQENSGTVCGRPLYMSPRPQSQDTSSYKTTRVVC